MQAFYFVESQTKENYFTQRSDAAQAQSVRAEGREVRSDAAQARSARREEENALRRRASSIGMGGDYNYMIIKIKSRIIEKPRWRGNRLRRLFIFNYN